MKKKIKEKAPFFNGRSIFFGFFLVVVAVTSGIYLFWRNGNMSGVDHYKPYSFIQETLSNGLEVSVDKR